MIKSPGNTNNCVYTNRHFTEAHRHTKADRHTQTHARARSRAHVHRNTQTHTRTHTHTHRYIHTNTRTIHVNACTHKSSKPRDETIVFLLRGLCFRVSDYLYTHSCSEKCILYLLDSMGFPSYISMSQEYFDTFGYYAQPLASTDIPILKTDIFQKIGF